MVKKIIKFYSLFILLFFVFIGKVAADGTSLTCMYGNSINNAVANSGVADFMKGGNVFSLSFSSSDSENLETPFKNHVYFMFTKNDDGGFMFFVSDGELSSRSAPLISIKNGNRNIKFYFHVNSDSKKFGPDNTEKAMKLDHCPSRVDYLLYAKKATIIFNDDIDEYKKSGKYQNQVLIGGEKKLSKFTYFNWDYGYNNIGKAVNFKTEQYSKNNIFLNKPDNTYWTNSCLYVRDWRVEKNYKKRYHWFFVTAPGVPIPIPLDKDSKTAVEQMVDYIQMDYKSYRIKVSAMSYNTNGKREGFIHWVKPDYDLFSYVKSWNGGCPVELEYDNGILKEPSSNPVIVYKLVNSSRGSSSFDYEDININSCEDLISSDLANYLKLFLNILKIAVAGILIVFGIIDFSKAMLNGEEDMKKAQSKFFKRVTMAVIFFLAPSLLKLFLSIISFIWPAIDSSLCGIL